MCSILKAWQKQTQPTFTTVYLWCQLLYWTQSITQSISSCTSSVGNSSESGLWMLSAAERRRKHHPQRDPEENLTSSKFDTGWNLISAFFFWRNRDEKNWKAALILVQKENLVNQFEQKTFQIWADSTLVSTCSANMPKKPPWLTVPMSAVLQLDFGGIASSPCWPPCIVRTSRIMRRGSMGQQVPNPCSMWWNQQKKNAPHHLLIGKCKVKRPHIWKFDPFEFDQDDINGTGVGNQHQHLHDGLPPSHGNEERNFHEFVHFGQNTDKYDHWTTPFSSHNFFCQETCFSWIWNWTSTWTSHLDELYINQAWWELLVLCSQPSRWRHCFFVLEVLEQTLFHTLTAALQTWLLPAEPLMLLGFTHSSKRHSRTHISFLHRISLFVRLRLVLLGLPVDLHAVL